MGYNPIQWVEEGVMRENRIRNLGTILVLFLCFCSSTPSFSQCSPARTFDGEPGALLGSAVAAAGDVDGDGFTDILAGAPGASPGKAHLYSGRTGGLIRTFTGSQASIGFGRAVAGMGDLDGDSIPDVAVGTLLPTTGAWSVILYSAKSGSILRTVGVNVGATVTGLRIADAGDVDGDGLEDLIAGVSFGKTEGRVFVFSSVDGAILHDLKGETENEGFGSAVAGAGDVDADGVPDLIVGSPESGEGGVLAGKISIYSGRPPKPGNPSQLLAERRGTVPYGRLGHSVAGAGLVDADKSADLLVASLGIDEIGHQAPGRVSVFSGLMGAVLFTTTYEPGPLEVSGGGDVDGDGRADLLVGRSDGKGRVEAFSGRTGTLLYRAEGEVDGDALGSSIASAGDVNGDGIPDLIAGAPWSGAGGDGAGRAYVFLLGDSDGDGIPDSCEKCEEIRPITPGFPVTVRMAPPSWSCLYHLRPEARTNLVVTLQASDPDSSDSLFLYGRWGSPPTPSAYDLAAALPGSPYQRMVIPSAREAECYLLLSAVSQGNGTEAILLVEEAELAVEGISVHRAARGSGALHATIRGGGFDAGTAFRLERGTTKITTSEPPVIVSSDRADVVLAIDKGAPLGIYSLVAEKPALQLTARLSGAFQVIASAWGPSLNVSLLGPERYRYRRRETFTLRIANEGDAEMPAPLLRISAVKEGGAPLPNSLLSLEADPDAASELLVLGADRSGVAGVLPPGGEVEIPIIFRSAGCRDCAASLRAALFLPGEGDFIEWDLLVRPKGMTEETWRAAWPPLSAEIGATWAEYGEALAEIATRLARRGAEKPESVRDLFRFAVRQALGRPSAAVVGTARLPSWEPIPNSTVLALQGGAVRSYAVADPAGRFALDWLVAGASYQVTVIDHDTVRPAVILPAEGDVLGLELEEGPRDSGLVPACPNRDESNLPVRPLLPPADLFVDVAGADFIVVDSWDPNTKEGPAGQGDDGSVGLGEELFYVIRFENEGTAPVQRAVIADALDPDLDLSTVRIHEAGFGGNVVELGGDGGAVGCSRRVTVEVPRADDPGGPLVPLDVEVGVALDPASGEIEWTFTSWPPDGEVGFLAVADPDSEDDEGYVSFSAMPLADSADGTEVENDAEVKFDANPPQTTNTVTNTVSRLLRPDVPSFPVPPDSTERLFAVGTILGWADAARAEEYDIYLWRASDPAPGAPTAAGQVPSEYDPPAGLEAGTTYRWRVVARNAAGSTGGPIWSFATLAFAACPPAASSPYPPQGGLGVPPGSLTLSWDEDARAMAYSARIWRASDGAVVSEALGLAGPRYALPVTLEAFGEYRWQVTSLAPGCAVPGPIWSFSTGAGSFRRGDPNADGAIDLGDGLAVLWLLFMGSGPPPCEESFDADDDGRIELADAVCILEHLFLGGPQPPAPYPACGEDPTADTLTCESLASGCGS
jgi:hypothetical protein